MKARFARKRFGQHFLRDRTVVEWIIASFKPLITDNVVEIGPGEGVLTRELLGKVRSLHVIEIDRDLSARLQTEFSSHDRLTIHTADALDFDFSTLAPGEGKWRVIGNLPYNISTPLLFHVLEAAPLIADMLFMLQKEVVARMCAEPGSKTYGRLSVMVQWRCQVEQLFDVPPSAFFPPPKVESSIVHLRPHVVPTIEISDPRHFSALVKAAFAQRRKTLKNALKGTLSEDALVQSGIDPGHRAEQLSLAQFASLSNAGR